MVHPATTMMFLRLFILLSVVARGRAYVGWDGDCPEPPSPEEACITVNTWDDLQETVASSAELGHYLVFCPFSLRKPTKQQAIEISNKALYMSCQQFGDCVVEGPGSHVVVRHEAEAVIQGISFRGSTDAALTIESSAPGDHMICDCSFHSSRSEGLAGAIVAESGTTVSVGRSHFSRNVAGGAGAVHNAGQMEIFDSSFNGNEGLMAAAIVNKEGAFLDLTRNNFADHSTAALISVDGSDDEEVYVADWNTGTGNEECNGVFDASIQRCHEFGVGLQRNVDADKVDSEALSSPTIQLVDDQHEDIEFDDPDQRERLLQRRMPHGYFNYNPRDDDYGPYNWHRLDVRGNEWEHFRGINARNQCERREQSPIDLGSGRVNEECYASHQLRVRWGGVKLDSHGVNFYITPTRLRLSFYKRGRLSRPTVDLPQGFAKLSAHHLEVAIPSLHRINGKRYDAEYSIVHPQNRKGRIVIVSVLIDASGEYNPTFQELLDEWEKVPKCRRLYKDWNRGARNRNRPRNRALADENLGHSRIFANTTFEEGDDEEIHRSLRAQRLDIYHRDLMPSIYFHAYHGSLPEPPCSSAHWRVVDKRMEINWQQLNQLKGLLKGVCREPVRNDYAVGLGENFARPIQAFENRDYWRCRRSRFPLDCERPRNGAYCDCDTELCPEDFE